MMPKTRKSKRFEAFSFKRSLNVAEYDYLSMEPNYTSTVVLRQENWGKNQKLLIPPPGNQILISGEYPVVQYQKPPASFLVEPGTILQRNHPRKLPGFYVQP
jgi:hypothetical protein